MSRNNPQGSQGGQQPPQGRRGRQQQPQQGQGGQQPRQGGQAGQQRQQGQSSQRRQGGQQGRTPQGSPPPQRGGSGGDDGIDPDAIKDIALWGIAAFAIAGIAFGLLPFLFGFMGDPGGTTNFVSANATEADMSANEEEVANEIISEELSDTNASAVSAYDQMQAQNSVVFSVIDNPLIGIIFALIAALLIGLRSSTNDVSLAAGVAVATVVGLVLFVVLSAGIAGFQYNSMSDDDWVDDYDTNPDEWNTGGYPDADVGDENGFGLDPDIQDRYVTEYEDRHGEEPRQDVLSAASISTIGTISGLEISYGTLVVNALVYGIIAALGAAGIAVASKRLSENVS